MFAWHNGQLVNASDLSVPVTDIGFRQGVVAVERLRTYDGRVASLHAHVVRWRRTIEELYLSVAVDTDAIGERIESLLEKNRGFIDEVRDCGITMLATPGDATSGQANEMMHLNAIDHERVARHRKDGQSIFVTDIHQPSGRCWPRDIKVRCRLHYYLADMQARDHHEDAAGLLVDDDGSVTDTSTSNIAIVKNSIVTSPPPGQVLPGVTQQTVRQVCSSAGVHWHDEALWPAEIRDADEVWLMGTDGGWWFANRVDGAAVGQGKTPSLYQTLHPDFDKEIRRQ